MRRKRREREEGERADAARGRRQRRTHVMNTRWKFPLRAREREMNEGRDEKD